MERKLKDRSSPPLPPSCPPLRNISDQTKTHGKIGGCQAEPLNRTQVVEKDDCVGNCGPRVDDQSSTWSQRAFRWWSARNPILRTEGWNLKATIQTEFPHDLHQVGARELNGGSSSCGLKPKTLSPHQTMKTTAINIQCRKFLWENRQSINCTADALLHVPSYFFFIGLYKVSGYWKLVAFPGQTK